MESLDEELACAQALVVRQHEIVRCWRTLYRPDELRFAVLPADMWAIITASPDYQELVPGSPPTQLHISGEHEAVELTAYRAKVDAQTYVLAPAGRGPAAVTDES